MKFIDLTHTLSEETIVYPGNSSMTRRVCQYYENLFKFEDITSSTGIGTHMDAPRHRF